MELSKGHMRPGRVLSVEDESGTIKACCCGLFSEEDDPELLPPMYPFPLGGANNFSKIHKDDEIWVLFFDDNPLELLYIRKDQFKDNLKDILSKRYAEVEVLASKELAAGFIQLYFNDGEGWIIRNVDSVIQMRPDGSILLDTGYKHRVIDICDDSVSLGSEGGSEHPAALGDKVVDALNKANSIFNAISKAAGSNPYTLPIKTAIDALRSGFESSIEEIESQHVTLD